MLGGIRGNREITVGIVDNDRFVLPSLKASIEELSDDMQVIWTTSDGGQAVANCLNASSRPKVLLADMSMEGVSGIYVQSCRFPEPSWSLALNSAPVLVFLMLLILNFGQTSRNRSKLLEMRLKAERAEELGRRVKVARMIHDSVTGDLANIARVSQRQLCQCGDPEQHEAWRQINEQSVRVLDGVHAVIRQLSAETAEKHPDGAHEGPQERLNERVRVWERRLSEFGIHGDVRVIDHNGAPTPFSGKDASVRQS